MNCDSSAGHLQKAQIEIEEMFSNRLQNIDKMCNYMFITIIVKRMRTIKQCKHTAIIFNIKKKARTKI